MNVLIISDLRLYLILTVIFLSRKFKSQKNLIIIAERFIASNDYGDYFPVWYRKLKVFLLKCFFGVRVIKANPITAIGENDLLGITSSICSITMDSLANEERYPVLYGDLANRTKGAIEICKWLDANKPASVCLFNGRTSASEPIARYCFYNRIKTFYYEFGNKFGQNFLLMKAPIHNAYQYTLDLINFHRNTILNHNIITDKGVVFAKQKLNNIYTKRYLKEPNESYDVVIFLCSDHEYTNVNPEMMGLEAMGNEQLCRRVLGKYGNGIKYAVRAHPNQMSDPSYEITIAPIIKLCQEHGIDFYGPLSDVSSYGLIKKSKIVAVELSSIGVDALLLGSEVDVFGNNNLKAILDNVPESLKKNKVLLSQYVSEVLGLMDEMYQHRFDSKFRLIGRVLYWFEYQIEKKIRPTIL